MGSTIAQTVPMMIASAVVPGSIIMVILLLRREGGLAIAVGYVGGMTAVRLAQGAFFGVVFNNVDTSEGENDSGTIVTVLLLVIGILMLVTALRLFLKEEDPDAPPPKWMQMINSMTPLTAFAMGAGILLVAAKHWIFLLGALEVIVDGDLSRTESIIAFLVFVLGTELVIIAPIVFSAVAPNRSAPVLRKTGDWLEQNNRPIAIAVSLIFGIYFLWKALDALLV